MCEPLLRTFRVIACLIVFANLNACQTRSVVRYPNYGRDANEEDRFVRAIQEQTYPDSDVQPASHLENIAVAPPKVREIDSLARWPMSVDDAVQIALQNSSVIRGTGGKVLAMPDAVRTALDPAIVQSDPNFGPDAALSAFDTRFETSMFWNGGGRSVGPGLSAGTFGLFSQPTTIATTGFGRKFETGTEVTIGGVGGYDSKLADGPYAAFGTTMRHPLLRGAGVEFNRIAGPNAKPGNYRGVWIAQIESDKAHLELEQAVRDLVRDVSLTYWELAFAYRNLETKRVARDHALESWEREKLRVAEQVSPPDFEAIARQQFYSADASVQNAISGIDSSPTGVYDVEIRLRSLLGLPTTDGRLIEPTTRPLEAQFVFDWQESLESATTRRIEIRKQIASIQRRELELKAACNLTRPQVDFVGQYRRLADEPGEQDALFGQALQGWRIGVEVEHALGNRREQAGVKNAELELRRDQVLLDEQERQLASQLRIAFTKLDRAFGVTQSLAVSRDAADVRLRAETERHAAGQADIETLLQSQVRAVEAATSYQRSLIDYNTAIINVHFARGSLLDMLEIGFCENASPGEVLYSQLSRSIFASGDQRGGEHLALGRDVESSRLPATERRPVPNIHR